MKVRMLPLVLSVMVLPALAVAADEMEKKDDMMEGHSDSMSMKGPMFEDFDANGDGMISSDELNIYGSSAAGDSAAERRMNEIQKHDMNNDGNISRDEFDEAVKKAQ